MKNLFLFVVLALCASTAHATFPRQSRNFNRGFNEGFRAAQQQSRGGCDFNRNRGRNFGPGVTVTIR